LAEQVGDWLDRSDHHYDVLASSASFPRIQLDLQHQRLGNTAGAFPILGAVVGSPADIQPTML